MATKRERKQEARQERLGSAIRGYLGAVVQLDSAIDSQFGATEREELQRSILGLGLGGLPLVKRDAVDLVAHVVDPAIVRALPFAGNGQVLTMLDSESLDSLSTDIENLILSLPWAYVVAYPLFRCDANRLDEVVDLLVPDNAPDFAAGAFARDLPLEAVRVGPISLGPHVSLLKPLVGDLELPHEERFVWMLATYFGYWPHVPVGCSILEATRRDAQKIVGLFLATGNVNYTAASTTPPTSEDVRPDSAPLQLKFAVRNRRGERRSGMLITPENNRVNDVRPTRQLRGVARSDALFSRLNVPDLSCDQIFRARVASFSPVVEAVGDNRAASDTPTLSDRIMLASYWLAESAFAATTPINELLFAVLSLEALLGEPSLEHNIQERLADRLAFYVGRSDGERTSLRRMVKEVYSLRSRIVHRGLIDHDETLLWIEIARLGPIVQRAISQLLDELPKCSGPADTRSETSRLH